LEDRNGGYASNNSCPSSPEFFIQPLRKFLLNSISFGLYELGL
jgi:hypothetical protein